MKALVVYYSLEGNTRLIAQMIAKITKADTLELKPKKQLNKNSFFKYVWGGRQVVMNEIPELEEIKLNVEKYDYVFLGSPVWVNTYAPALKAFLAKFRLEKKNIGLFCCYAGHTGNTFNHLKVALPKNKIIGTIDFKDPIKLDKKLIEDKVTKWLNRFGF